MIILWRTIDKIYNMPLINDTNVYNLASLVAGCTVIGSLPSGQTVQFDLYAAIQNELIALDFQNVNDATKELQHIVGNVPGDASTSAPGINSGRHFFATIKPGVTTFPPTDDSHVNFLARVRS